MAECTSLYQYTSIMKKKMYIMFSASPGISFAGIYTHVARVYLDTFENCTKSDFVQYNNYLTSWIPARCLIKKIYTITIEKLLG